jgi:hypothetical protein
MRQRTQTTHASMYVHIHTCMHATMKIAHSYMHMNERTTLKRKPQTRPGQVAVVEEPTYFLSGKVDSRKHLAHSRISVPEFVYTHPMSPATQLLPNT